ncbi:carbohydrate ABC transporter permease [Nonomuraea helvata]|uniref:Carbohydrate ABC transporter permease n=1 Tax=Nonomuraea helvata TaxID=37484 RepID=A0ABV5SIR9_9ACTN
MSKWPTSPLSRRRALQAMAFVVLALFSLLMLAPFLWALNTSFKSEADASASPVTVLPEGGYTWDIYAHIFRTGDIPTWMVNFLRIVLPLSRPIIAAVAIFTFVGAWNNFLWPFIVTNDPDLMTLPVGLQTVMTGYGLAFAQNMASAVLAALPLIVVFLFFQRQIIKGIATTGLGGQ